MLRGVSERVRVPCRVHGWQDPVVFTRHEAVGHGRDVPDRYVCQECVRQGVAPGEGNALRIGPPDARTALRAALAELARHLRAWRELDLAGEVERVLASDAADVVAGALALLGSGGGGLLDRPLRKPDGRVDEQATHRRDLLAERVRAAACTVEQERP